MKNLSVSNDIEPYEYSFPTSFNYSAVTEPSWVVPKNKCWYVELVK